MRPLVTTILALAVATGAHSADRPYQVETLAEGLQHPWSLAWLPDGRMLVTERVGRLNIISAENADSIPVAGVPEAFVDSQAGLFEVLPSPEFENDQRLYLSLAQGERGDNTLIVVRGRLIDNELIDIEEVFRHEPARTTSVHYGGRMRFLGDGTLVVSLGDGFDYRERAQHLMDHFGTLVRIQPDGAVPADNPFTDRPDVDPRIYAYGLRNVQGLALNPADGRLWATDHGPRGGDRLHRIEPGANYGWPKTSHALDYTGATITPFRELPDVAAPVTTWSPAFAPSAAEFYTGDAFPEWQGDLFLTGLAARQALRLRIDSAGRIAAETVHFAELERRLRDVRTGPDGAIYLLTDHEDGELLRAVPRE